MTDVPIDLSTDIERERLGRCLSRPAPVDASAELAFRALADKGLVTLVPVAGTMISRASIPDHWLAYITDAGRAALKP